MGVGRLIYYCAIPANLSSKLVALICVYFVETVVRVGQPLSLLRRERASVKPAFLPIPLMLTSIKAGKGLPLSVVKLSYFQTNCP